MTYDSEALRYHQEPRPGKIEVIPSKPCLTQTDLSLAYTPGVAAPCLRIEQDPDASFNYTTRGNLVAVITNGTAVLGLGNIGPLAGKPVMEGKGVLFKRFADLDVFDIEVDTRDPDEFIRTVKLLEPTFGGINLEDIRAPDCFYIEERLTEMMSIPVFHDDQHGTAIISGAALLNACELAGHPLEEIRIVVNGAGAAGIACARMYVELGARRENILLVDSKGVIYKGREEGMNPYKEAFAGETPLRTLQQAVKEAHVLVGVSTEGAFDADLLAGMAKDPIIFALANPEPEIGYYEAKAARPDAIVATGRSDYPNQVNNVLCFPFLFRGALDVRATTINASMKVAAVHALAGLAREDVPDSVIRAYGGRPIHFGPDYLIPKPLDLRVLLTVAPAVAKAAVESGAARISLPAEPAYVQILESRLGAEREILHKVAVQAQQDPRRIVLPEGDNPVILRAAHEVAREGIARPLLLGNEEKIRSLARELQVSLEGVEILDNFKSPLYDRFVEVLFEKRARKGWSLEETRRQLRSRYVFGAAMVLEGYVDGQVHGIGRSYPDAIRPVLQVIPRRSGISKVSGSYLLILKGRTLLLADTTVNFHPSAEDLAEIALLASEQAVFFDINPRIAMVSFSNFGSTRHPDAMVVEEAVKLCRRKKPGMVIDGEMQVDTALSEEIVKRLYPFCRLGGPANVLIFPNLDAGNAAFKLLEYAGGAKAVGPLLMGLSKPFNVLQRSSDMENVVHVIAITVAQAQELKEREERG